MVYTHKVPPKAPQARQVADRFHLLQNLRNAIEQQLTRAPSRQLQRAPQEMVVLSEPPGLIHRYGPPEVTEHRHLVQAGRRGRSQQGFDRVKVLHTDGKTLAQIARETGFNWRTVRKWTQHDAFRPHATMAPKSTTPVGFGQYLARRWNEGCTMGRQLLAEIRLLGYTGSLTHLQRLLNSWRQAHFAAVLTAPMPEYALLADVAAAPLVPPIVASALCIKPRGMLTAAQAEKVDELKASSTEFTAMRALAMRFRGLLTSGDIDGCDNEFRVLSHFDIGGEFGVSLVRRQAGVVAQRQSVVFAPLARLTAISATARGSSPQPSSGGTGVFSTGRNTASVEADTSTHLARSCLRRRPAARIRL